MIHIRVEKKIGSDALLDSMLLYRFVTQNNFPSSERCHYSCRGYAGISYSFATRHISYIYVSEVLSIQTTLGTFVQIYFCHSLALCLRTFWSFVKCIAIGSFIRYNKIYILTIYICWVSAKRWASWHWRNHSFIVCFPTHWIQMQDLFFGLNDKWAGVRVLGGVEVCVCTNQLCRKMNGVMWKNGKWCKIIFSWHNFSSHLFCFSFVLLFFFRSTAAKYVGWLFAVHELWKIYCPLWLLYLLSQIDALNIPTESTRSFSKGRGENWNDIFSVYFIKGYIIRFHGILFIVVRRCQQNIYISGIMKRH